MCISQQPSNYAFNPTLRAGGFVIHHFLVPQGGLTRRWAAIRVGGIPSCRFAVSGSAMASARKAASARLRGAHGRGVWRLRLRSGASFGLLWRQRLGFFRPASSRLSLTSFRHALHAWRRSLAGASCFGRGDLIHCCPTSHSSRPRFTRRLNFGVSCQPKFITQGR